MAITVESNVTILAASGDELDRTVRPFLLAVDGAVADITDSNGNPIWTDQAAAAQIYVDSCAWFTGIKRGAGAGKLYVFEGGN